MRFGHNQHRGLAIRKAGRQSAKACHHGIRVENEVKARDDAARYDCARNRLQRVSSLIAQRCGALKADSGHECKHRAKADRRQGKVVKLKLSQVHMTALFEQNGSGQSDSHSQGRELDA